MEENKLMKIIPFLGSFFIFCGAINLYVYYINFNINIFDYLEFTEILTSFLILLIQYTSAFLLFFLLILFIPKKKILEFEKSKTEIIKKDKFLTRLKNYYKIMKYLILAFPVLFIVFLCLQDKISSILLITLTIYFLIIFAVPIVGHEMRRKYNIQHFYYNFAVATLLFIIWIIFDGFHKIDKVKNQQKNSNVDIKFNDYVLQSDSLNYYIGKTNGYIFYYEEKNNTTRVFPMNLVKEISFKPMNNQKAKKNPK